MTACELSDDPASPENPPGTVQLLSRAEAGLFSTSLAKADLAALAPRPRGFLLLVVRPGAPSSVLAPSSDALCS